MTIRSLTTNQPSFSLPVDVKNIKLETYAAGPKGALVTTHITRDQVTTHPTKNINFRMKKEGDATFVLADEKIQAIAGGGGNGTQGGIAGQPAALPQVVFEKYFAYVNDTSDVVQTDILYEEKHPIFFLADNGYLRMPFGYRIDPSTAEAVWPYLGFTTSRVRIEADQVIGPGFITLTVENNRVTWNTQSVRLPTGRYTLTDLLARITTIFQTQGDRGFRMDYMTDTQTISIDTLYTVRFTNPTGSIWAALGFTVLTLIPPGPPVKQGDDFPVDLINAGLTLDTFPIELDKMWYTPSSPRADIVELLGLKDGDGIYRYTYQRLGENGAPTGGGWTAGKRIRSAFAFPSLDPNNLITHDTDSPFLFSTSGSLVFGSFPPERSKITTNGGEPLTLQGGATPFFTMETWVKFDYAPDGFESDQNDKIIHNEHFEFYRDGHTGRLGFKINNQEWLGGETILEKDIWYHLAVVSKPRNTIIGGKNALGIQAGMVCSGPGIKGYALVTEELTIEPSPDDIDVVTFRFESSEIILFVNGIKEPVNADLVDWTVDMPDTPLNIGLEKTLLSLVENISTSTSTAILDVAQNDDYVYLYLVHTSGVDILGGTGAGTVNIPNAAKIALFGTRVYVATTDNIIKGYTIGANGMLTPVSGDDTSIAVLNMTMTNDYVYVVIAGAIQTWQIIPLDGSLNLIYTKALANADKIVIHPAGTYAYVTTNTKLYEYPITNGELVTPAIERTVTVNNLVVTDTYVYITTNAGVKVYETGGLTLFKSITLATAEYITVDLSGRIYVTVGNFIHFYQQLTNAGEFVAGAPYDTDTTLSGLYGRGEGGNIWITSAENWGRYIYGESGGKVSNVRITHEPVYQTDFIPSVVPLSALSSTSLLLLCEEEIPLENNASFAFFEFFAFFAATEDVLTLPLELTLTTPQAGCYILSFDYENDTEDNNISINDNLYPIQSGTFKFNQAVYINEVQLIDKTDTGSVVTLSNIRLKKIVTTDIGKGGASGVTFAGGRGVPDGASSGPLQPFGSGGGTSYPPFPLATSLINTDSLPQGATLTYLNGITLATGNQYTTFDANAAVFFDTNAPLTTLNMVTYGQNFFLAGERGTSTLAKFDGSVWRDYAGPSGILWQGLFYSPEVNLFLGVTDDGDIWTTNGADWQLKYAAGWTSTGKVSIVYATSGFVIINDTTRTVIRSNKTGTRWTKTDDTLPETADGYIGLATDQSGVVAVTSSNLTVATSTDSGITWQSRTLDVEEDTIIDVVYGHQGFKIITTTGYVYTSFDTVTWTRDTNRIGRYGNGTVTITGTTKTITMTSTAGISVGQSISGTAGTGTLVNGVVESINEDEVTLTVTGTATVGTITNIITPIGDITGIAYGGGKYLVLGTDKYALGNTWVITDNPVGFAGAAVTFGQGLFLTDTGYTLGEYDTALYSAAISDDLTSIEITRFTMDGLKTTTSLSMPTEYNYLVINNLHYIPLTDLDLDGGLKGKPLLTSGVFPFSNTVYRKVQVELIGASGGGSQQNAGGKGARVIMRGATLSEAIYLGVGMAGIGPGPMYPGGGGTSLWTLNGDDNDISTGFVVAGGGGGAGANGNGGNAAENTGQKGQDGSGSLNSGGSDEIPGLNDGTAKINIGDTPGNLLGPYNGIGGGGGGGLTGGGTGFTDGGGGGGGSGTEGINYMAISYETASTPGTGSIRIVTLPRLTLDGSRSDTTILYLIQPSLPTDYPYSQTVSYVVKIDAESNVLITARTAELETVQTFNGDAQQYETVVIIEEETQNTHIFGKTPPICFHTGTGILTPSGYVPVEELTTGALVLTAQGETVPILEHVTFQVAGADCPLFGLKADSLAPGLPLKDLYMSHNHAFKVGGHWRHMKCSFVSFEKSVATVTYHHLYLPDYFRSTLVAEGVEVESAFKETRYQRMGWLCEATECIPLKCERINL